MTDADKFVDRLLEMHPLLRSLPDKHFDSLSWDSLEVIREINRMDGLDLGGMSPSELAWLVDNDPRVLSPIELSLWSRWRNCRHVYEFDETLAMELARTSAPVDTPVSALTMLPYPIVYVAVPTTLYTVDGMALESKGYFVWEDVSIGGETYLNEGVHGGIEGCSVRSLSMLYVLRDGSSPRGVVEVSLNLGMGDIGGMVDELFAYDVQSVTELRAYGQIIEVAEDYPQKARESICSALSSLLYIVSENADVRVEYRPSTEARRVKHRQCASTVHSVGTVVGRELGAARVRYERTAEYATGARVRPHIRAAHWQHYWTGPRDRPEERSLVLRWKEPIFVNKSLAEGSDMTTTRHRAR